jgi:hypothetical protein
MSNLPLNPDSVGLKERDPGVGNFSKRRMAMTVRESIVHLYRARGVPTPLASLAATIGMSTDELVQQLEREPRLADIGRLDLQQVAELVEFYGSELLFDEELTKRIREYLHVRAAIERIRQPESESSERPRVVKSLSIRPIRR